MFLEKYAKLKGKVDYDGDQLIVSVIDDEIDDDEPVMWLGGYVSNTGDMFGEEVEKPVLQVDVINFDDSKFFQMNQQRQDRAGVILLRNFIKYYQQNFEDYLVSTSFANYELQEKFKEACEKGIFPKESLQYIEQTTKEDYKSNSVYNMDNRKIQNEYKNNPSILFPELNFEDNKIKNEKLSTVISTFIKVANENTFLGEIYSYIIGYIDNGNVYYEPPHTFQNLDSLENGFEYSGSNNIVKFNNYISLPMKKFVVENGDLMSEYFDINNIDIAWYEDGYNSEKLEQLLFEVNSNKEAFNRLKKMKKNGVK